MHHGRCQRPKGSRFEARGGRDAGRAASGLAPSLGRAGGLCGVLAMQHLQQGVYGRIRPVVGLNFLEGMQHALRPHLDRQIQNRLADTQHGLLAICCLHGMCKPVGVLMMSCHAKLTQLHFRWCHSSSSAQPGISHIRIPPRMMATMLLARLGTRM